MIQAITTKYLGPTDHRGSRVKAQCAAGSITLEWDDSLNSDHNHQSAALSLAVQFDWSGRWIGGGNHDGTCVWVCDTADPRDSFTL